VKGVEVIYHTAFRAQGAPQEMWRINTQGTRRLLEACAGDIRRFVSVGSVAVYASHPTPETWPVRADAPRAAHGTPQLEAYGNSMIDAEDYILEASRLYGVEHVLLRTTTIWGRNPYAISVLRTLMSNPNLAERMNERMGPMQWVHGIDVARACVLAGRDERARNEVFIVAGAQSATSFDLLSLAWEMTRPSESNPFQELAARHNPPRPKIDISKIETVLGFRPAISLRESVEEIVCNRDISPKAIGNGTARGEASSTFQGKTCIITGATSGIGRAVALLLGEMGARLVLVGRDRAKGEETLAQLRKAKPSIVASMHYGDLSRLDDVRSVADEILTANPRIDVLINNVGAIFDQRELTPDGLERTFAINHMAHFLLTALLEERLVASAPAQVITVASSGHRGVALDFDDLQNARNFDGKLASKRSKLCNILFTRELARRLSDKGVVAWSVCPGFVASGIGDNLDERNRAWFRLAKANAAAPEAAADMIVRLAGAPQAKAMAGKYFENGEPAAASPEAEDDDAARRLWVLSARLAGITAGSR
jgi:NAD(P)-dependent dehydrogenase (short-subunit alcohol dehydrogenase family)/dTDP-4-dehydrorhamnose reductase